MHRPRVVVDEAMNKRIKGYFANARSKDEVVYGFIEGYLLGIHKGRWLQNRDSRVPPQQFKNAVNIGALIATNSCSDKWATKIALADNPLFALNGHDGIPSTATATHLLNQVYEAAARSVGSMIVPAPLAVAGKIEAAGASEARLLSLQAIAKKNRNTGTIADWLNVVIQMAKRKRNVRGVQMASNVVGCVIPGVATLAKPVVMYLQSGKASFEFTVMATAIELHWRAYVEQRLGAEGPASRILYELFRYRGAKQLISESQIKAFIKEPAGWLPIKDALLSL
ncbi:hypothetical protein [Ketobacter alkanivorans]|uniref:Uncharacterized protein n=1 Tax=Ketobacter alkanivorans TaxID=1917421 RepID=A0A2K9LL13_9GAMM|nr:hypothetical protein [Ketobacter alkanivorans]AUM12927.1 hypothetical protein Kalk_11055 [Ketobacter alkanivorans]